MDKKLHVALAATEAVPYAKAGGLADVISALASALQKQDVAVTLLLPGHALVDRERFSFKLVPGLEELAVGAGGRQQRVSVQQAQLPGTQVDVLLIEHPGYFHRAGIYFDPESGVEYPDSAERYAFFCRAALTAVATMGRPLQILHMNDYHTALMALYVREPDLAPFYSDVATVFSIHNLGYQGLFDARDFSKLGLPASYMRPLGALEFWGKMNFMKAGLETADVITTVSPTYAEEIQQSDEHAFGLLGLLRRRRNDLFGILNGIDDEVWNPATDSFTPARYDAADLSGKLTCKRMLQERLQLPVDSGVPVFGMITRLASQKGLDLLFEAEAELLRMPIQMVILGAGQPEYEERLAQWGQRHPERVAIKLGFDEELAHWIEAGSDFFLMPSRYEPCGLNQMYSMRYGTLPVVRRTGGLADTVVDWTSDTESGTGFVFERYDASSLLDALQRAVEAYRRPDAMHELIRRAMGLDFSWRQSARRYLEIYATARERHATEPPRAPGPGP